MGKIVDKTKQIIAYLASIESDKYFHLLVCLIVAFAATVILTPFSYDVVLPPVMALFLTMLLGIAKETYDSYQPDNTFSWKDLLFDLIGTVLGIVMALL